MLHNRELFLLIFVSFSLDLIILLAVEMLSLNLVSVGFCTA